MTTEVGPAARAREQQNEARREARAASRERTRPQKEAARPTEGEPTETSARSKKRQREREDRHPCPPRTVRPNKKHPPQARKRADRGGGGDKSPAHASQESAGPNARQELTRASQHTQTNRETSLSVTGGAKQAFRVRLRRNLVPGGEGTQSRVKTMPDDSLLPLWGLPENQFAHETAPPLMSVRIQLAQVHGHRVTYGPSELSFSHAERSIW